MLYRQQEILETLLNGPKGGMTTAEIYNHAVKQPGSELRHTTKDIASRLLFDMRGKKPPLITTSEAKGGAKHRLTPTGRKAITDWLDKQNGKPQVQLETLGDHPTDPTPTLVVETAQPAPSEPLGDNPMQPKPTLDLGTTPLVTPAIDAAVESFARDGYLLLDPNSELDAPFIQIIAALRTAQAVPEPVKIERKTLKLDTLNRLSALMSDDIHAVLEDIATDLDQLEAA